MTDNDGLTFFGKKIKEGLSGEYAQLYVQRPTETIFDLSEN